jgi:uncharacterized lipoprotein YddW (UPF0748 family)
VASPLISLLLMALLPPLPEPIQIPPPVSVAPYLPFPNLPALALDEANNGVGIAQKITRERNLQARILWIDATANLDRVNSAEKIQALVQQVKDAGFNTIVFDVKPIIGLTLYPSQYARKMTEWVRPWGTKTLPIEFDPLKEMAIQAKNANLSLLVNFNAFSEGHREFPTKGQGISHPDWQSVTYELETRIRRDGKEEWSYLVSDKPNVPARSQDDLALYTDLEKLPTRLPAGTVYTVIDSKGNSLALLDGSLRPTLPQGGAALVGLPGAGAGFLRQHGQPGMLLELLTRPIFVPVGQRLSQVPLMTSPHHPQVRQRILDMLAEVMRYDIDGVIFDDRLRYASLNADFSDYAKKDFESWLGKKINWPDDVFRYEISWPGLERRVVPGPSWEAWLVFRAMTTRNFVADAAKAVKSTKSSAVLATYVGSWYPDYPDIGANWAADDVPAGYRFLTESYKKTGWAGLVDFVITGCYHGEAVIKDAALAGKEVGFTVEAAGQFSNRAVNDSTFVYAGLSLERFKNNPDGLKRALQAAGATTQGIMCFDLSHDIDPLWPVFTRAFEKPVVAPHATPGLLEELRKLKADKKAAGIPDLPAILYRGVSGTGF